MTSRRIRPSLAMPWLEYQLEAAGDEQEADQSEQPQNVENDFHRHDSRTRSTIEAEAHCGH
jgi:hypothetical protein